MKILIATPCAADQVHRMYMHSILTQTFNASDRLTNQNRYNIALYTAGGFSGLGKDRGVMASHALRNGFDKLFFIDADQSWIWPQFKRIVDSDKPITCGIVPLKKYPLALNFTPLEEDLSLFKAEDSLVTPEGLIRIADKYIKFDLEPQKNLNLDTTFPVKLAGTAFMCIDVKVLKTLAQNGSAPVFYHADSMSGEKVMCWDFFQSGAINGFYIGEDWGFCAQAAHAGFTTYMDSQVLIDHHGQHTYQIGASLKFDERFKL